MKKPTAANPNPPPPKVGAILEYHNNTEPDCEVRAVVDHLADDTYGHLYQLVVRAPSIKRPGTYSYSLVDAHSIGLGLYIVRQPG